MKRRVIQIIFATIIFVWVNTSSGAIINPSFESLHEGYMPNGNYLSNTIYSGMPDDWSWRNFGATNGHVTSPLSNPIDWVSDGGYSLYVFAGIGSNHSVGDFVEFYQDVDMTGMSDLLFDVHLRGGDYTNSYLAIDSQIMWINNQAGTFIDTTIDISNFSGVHEIELGVEVFQDYGWHADGWTYFDNLRLVPEPGTVLLFGLGGLILRRRRA